MGSLCRLSRRLVGITLLLLVGIGTVNKLRQPTPIMQVDFQTRESIQTLTESIYQQNSTTRLLIEPYKGWRSMDELGIDPKVTKTLKGASTTSEPIMTTRLPVEKLNLTHTDWIYCPDAWDGSPIVLVKYKLIFFTVPKAGSTVFKQLFRRMEGHPNWRQMGINQLPHHPDYNGLKYLHQYPIHKAKEFMTSPNWTRAIFVRDPKERILSAYLDKGQRDHADFVKRRCCLTERCATTASESFAGFLQIIRHCNDSHWIPQAKRMEGRFWPYIDFIGHMDHAQDDAKRLMDKLGKVVWQTHGSSGWGRTRMEPIFESTGTVKHKTDADKKLHQYYTKETEAMVHDLFAEDYRSPLFGFNFTTMLIRSGN